jgi:hypothetical protein
MLLDLAVRALVDIDDRLGDVVARRDPSRRVVQERERDDRPVLPGPDLVGLAGRRPVADADGVVAPRVQDLDRPPGLAGQVRRRDRIIAEAELAAEAAAHVVLDDGDVGRRELEGPGQAVADAVDALGRIVDDEVVALPHGDAAVRLGRVVDLEARPVGPLDDDVGLREALLDVAPRVLVDLLDIGLVVADLRGTRVAGLLPVDDVGERLVFDLDEGQGLLGRPLVDRGHGRDLLSGVADLALGELQGGHDPRQGQGRREVDRDDLGRRVGRAKVLADEHPAELDIVGEFGPAGDDLAAVDAGRGLPDVLELGGLGLGLRLGGLGRRLLRGGRRDPRLTLRVSPGDGDIFFAFHLRPPSAFSPRRRRPHRSWRSCRSGRGSRRAPA